MAIDHAFKRFGFANAYPSTGFYISLLMCICSKLGNNFCTLCKMLQMLLGRLDCHYAVYAISTETGIFCPKRVFSLSWLRPQKSIRKCSAGELKHRQSMSQMHKRMSHIREDLEKISQSLWRCGMPTRTSQMGVFSNAETAVNIPQWLYLRTVSKVACVVQLKS